VSHVVAHLALNAEGFTGALEGALTARPTTMYRSNEAREEDIARLAAAAPAALTERLGAAVVQLDLLLPQVEEALGSARIERTPGSGRFFTVADVPGLRLREVEIHHCDLGPEAGPYSPAAWPNTFSVDLIERGIQNPGGTSFHLTATDLGRTWTIGEPGPSVIGDSYTLAWWLTGRPPFPGSTGPVSSDGALPRIEGP
jgi:maleylpyruvate isomerase